VPLVGRDDALRRLGRAYARARAGQGRVVLISGEAGIGKSRLMQDFATGLAGRARLVVGSGHETEQGLPYWPLVEALRPHLPAIDWAALGVEPLYLAQVARLLPELRTLLPDLPAPSAVEPAQAQERLFRALAHCLLSLASQPHPLILCLDDLHWADEATLSWLGYLARRLKRAPVLVVGAYRTEEAAAVAALRAGLRRLGVMEEVRLKGLPVTEVLHMVRHLSGQSSGAELFSQRLHWETGGNPFYLLETLRAMFEAGILWQDETGWSTNVDETTEDYRELPLPDTVGQAIRDRVRRLSPQSCQVLEAGAVIGHRFDFDLVRVTSGRRESEVVDALDALLARQVISEHDDRYRFNHDIIRTVVYGDLSYGRRRLLHRRAGEALEKLQLGQAARYAEVGRTADIVVQLARHFQAAGIAEKAILYLGRAGNNAVYLSANQEAITHLTKGLELLKTLPDTPERTQQELDLQITLGPALMATRGYAAPEVGNAYVRARELCRQVGETSQLFPVVWGLWAFYLLRAELQTAHELGERLLSLAQSVRQSALLLQAQHALGVTLFHLGEVASARVHLEQGIALYDPQQHHSHAFLYGHDPGVVCLSYVARALWHLGYPDQALDRSCQAVTLAQELSHPYSLAFALAFTAYLHHFLRERQATQERLEELMPLCTEQGFAQWLSAGTHLQGWALTEQGQEEEGIGQMRQSLAADRATGTGLGRPWLLAPLAEAYGKVGQAEEGLTVLAEALDFANKKGERWYEAELHRLKGELLLMQGEGEADTSATLSTRVEACFQHAIEIARQQSAKTFELRAVMSLSRLLQSQGKGEEAQGMLAEIYGWFTEGFDTPDLQEARALLEELS
jgi:predicted ATPase